VDRAPEDSKPRKRRISKRVVFAIVVFSALPVLYFGEGVYDSYGYFAGTPTTATVTSCRAPRSRHGGFLRALSERSCKATWTVGGESHTGHITGPRDGYEFNQSVEVSVLGDTAFTQAGASWKFLSAGIAAGLIGLPILFLLWIGKPRRRDSS
jgi:hypothetical protein